MHTDTCRLDRIKNARKKGEGHQHRLVYNKDVFHKSTNYYKLPQTVLGVCDAMKKNADGEEIRAIVPDELISYVRQYDPSIHLIYGRDAGKDSRTDTMEAAIVYDVINNEEQDKETFREALALSGCNYLVLSEEHTMDWYAEEEYEKIAKIDEYCIYRIDK